jgi:hypothetical protein
MMTGPPTEPAYRAKKTDIEHGKHSNHQARTDNQHNQRRSIEKASSRLNRRLDDMPSFLVHKTVPSYPKAARELRRAAFVTNCRSTPVPFIT